MDFLLTIARVIFRRLPYHFRYRLKVLVFGAGARTPLSEPHLFKRSHITINASQCSFGGQKADLVSIVLPVYNQAALLRESIQSVLAQTYPLWELIIVNDGSTDGVEQVLDEFAGHLQIRILKQSNQKLPKALSNGFECARGEFWTWTSADNLMHPEQLARQVAYLRAHPDVTMVYSDYLAIDDRGALLSDPDFRPQNRRTPTAAEIHLPRSVERLNTGGDNYIGACFMYRGWAGKILGEYAPELGVEDYDYWMRMNALFHIEHLGTDELLYRYRVHDNTLNARAKELKIYSRAGRVMAYERERQRFYQRPFVVFADAPTRAWLESVKVIPHSVRPFEELATTGDAQLKALVLVHAASLEALPAGQGTGKCVAAWFDPESVAPYRRRIELRERVDLCFAQDELTAARLGVLNSLVLQIKPGQTLFDLAVTFANNHLFYRATYSPEQCKRVPPEACGPRGRPLRVMLQVDDFLQGGMERVVTDLAQILAEQGNWVALLILGQEGKAAADARRAGIEVLNLPVSQREVKYRELLVEHGIDLVNAHYSLFGASSAADLHIPFVQTLHNTYVWFSPNQIAAYRACDAYTKAYVCVSNDVAFYSDSKLSLPPDKMVVIPNGVDSSRLRVPDAEAARQSLRRELGLGQDDFVFLNVAALYPPKGQRLLVSALAQIAPACPRARLVILGPVLDALYTNQIRREITSAGLEGVVVMVDPRDEVAAFYQMADAFVLPSFWEGWSLSLTEAMVVQLPIIASAVGGACDLLAGNGNYLVPPPFDAITDLDLSSLNSYLEQEHPRYVGDLADAMGRACANSSLHPPSAGGCQQWERQHAYGKYLQLFRWLANGGDPVTARSWLG